jgi:predicted phage-related endonuclease
MRKSIKPRRFKIERHPLLGVALHPLRATDVTASVAAGLWDNGRGESLHAYATPASLFFEKHRGISRDEHENMLMLKGRILEPGVAKLYQEWHPQQVVRKVQSYYRMPELRLGASPDYLGRDERGRKFNLQCKTVTPAAFKKSWTEETAPTWIVLQTLIETVLMRCAYGIIAALEVGDYVCRLHEYLVPRNERAWDRIRDGVAKFWAATEPPDFLPADRSLLAIVYPRQEPDKVVDLTGDNALPGLLDERLQLKEEIAAKIERKDEIEARLMAKMGDAEYADIPGWRATWKHEHHKAHEVKASDRRVLRIAKDKEEKEEAA